ncbi:MAG: 2-amino-4-hydroxy-6-hydroxymethyldihydropteridine diphosphokinase, partial [bacterium]|nr:2-amino-4-hydroxy-6-hydroxymethyldihydropteridine diphosphokinase [bacterium]
KILKNFEKRMGRDIQNSHYKSRTIDIDILLAEDRVINTETLTIPHKEMHKREFVLLPLHEIAPDVIHPVFNKKINRLLKPLKP